MKINKLLKKIYICSPNDFSSSYENYYWNLIYLCSAIETLTLKQGSSKLRYSCRGQNWEKYAKSTKKHQMKNSLKYEKELKTLFSRFCLIWHFQNCKS